MERFEIKKYRGKEVESHWRGQNLHRVGGPALIERFATGYVYTYYYRHGKLHRRGGPAQIMKNSDGSTYQHAYYREGRLHRRDGPALICWHPNGSMSESYYVDGQRIAPVRPSRRSALRTGSHSVHSHDL